MFSLFQHLLRHKCICTILFMSIAEYLRFFIDNVYIFHLGYNSRYLYTMENHFHFLVYMCFMKDNLSGVRWIDFVLVIIMSGNLLNVESILIFWVHHVSLSLQYTKMYKESRHKCFRQNMLPCFWCWIYILSIHSNFATITFPSVAWCSKCNKKETTAESWKFVLEWKVFLQQ